MERSSVTSDCFSRRAFLLFLLSFCGLAVGCSRSPYDMARVTGKVLLDGQPLSTGSVMFAPKSTGKSLKSGKAALGKLEADGSFVLSTYGNKDGAVVAEHAVTVLNTKPDSEAGRRMDAKRVLVPGLLQVSAEGENDFTIELTSEMVAKYGVRK